MRELEKIFWARYKTSINLLNMLGIQVINSDSTRKSFDEITSDIARAFVLLDQKSKSNIHSTVDKILIEQQNSNIQKMVLQGLIGLKQRDEFRNLINEKMKRTEFNKIKPGKGNIGKPK